MSDEGVFALHRAIFDHPLFKNSPERFYAWTWLLAHAVWKPTRVRVGSENIALERGDLSYSERFLAKNWGWSKSRVNRLLDLFEREKMIVRKSDHGQNHITICNYDEYQFSRTSDRTSSGPAADQQRTKEEEGNKDNKDNKREDSVSAQSAPKPKNVSRGTRLPEGWTPDEVARAYALTILTPDQLQHEIENFTDYWRAKAGVGAVKLDWPATWRTWVRNSVKFGGGNGPRGSRQLQDDSKSVSRAADRLAVEIERGNVQFAPRPSLMPSESQGNIRVLPKR